MSEQDQTDLGYDPAFPPSGANPTPEEFGEDLPVAAAQDETDVSAALERHTDDGKGDEDPGPGDFDSFASPDAEETGTIDKPFRPGDTMKRTAQGNTDPRDFDVFDDRGVFVEKRDR